MATEDFLLKPSFPLYLNILECHDPVHPPSLLCNPSPCHSPLSDHTLYFLVNGSFSTSLMRILLTTLAPVLRTGAGTQKVLNIC